MNKVHYGVPERRPACGHIDRNLAQTTDRSKVTCLACLSTHKFRERWHGKR